MVLYDKQIRDLLDLKLYVDTPDDIRFIRRLKRDIASVGERLKVSATSISRWSGQGISTSLNPRKCLLISLFPKAATTKMPYRC